MEQYQSYTNFLDLENLENEIWKPAVGFQNYMVSNYGRIKSLKRVSITANGARRTFPERIMRCQNYQGYLRTQLVVDGKSKTVKVHRVVAEAFLENPDKLPQINHIDENKQNNTLRNLEWCSVKYNMNYNNRQQRIFEKQLANGSVAKRVQEMKQAIIIRIKCTTTGEIFDSISDATRKYGVDSSSISKCLRGELNNTGKMLIDGKLYYLEWEKAEDTEVQELKVNLSKATIVKGKGKLYRNINTGLVFQGAREACEYFNLNPSSVKLSDSCNNPNIFRGKAEINGKIEKLKWEYV